MSDVGLQVKPEILKTLFQLVLQEPNSRITLSFQPENLILKGQQQGDVLQVVIITPELPRQEALLDLCRRVWQSCPSENVKTLYVCGQKSEEEFIAWVQEVQLERSQPCSQTDPQSQPMISNLPRTGANFGQSAVAAQPSRSSPDPGEEDLSFQRRSSGENTKPCPICGQPARRIQRKPLDRLLSHLQPVGRYACGDRQCGWEGLRLLNQRHKS